MTYSEMMERKRDLVELVLYQHLCMDAIGNFVGVEDLLNETGQFYVDVKQMAEPNLQEASSDNAIARKALTALKVGNANILFCTTLNLTRVIDDLKLELKKIFGDFYAGLFSSTFGHKPNLKLASDGAYVSTKNVIHAVAFRDEKMFKKWDNEMAGMNKTLVDLSISNANLVMYCANELKKQSNKIQEKYDYSGLGVSDELIQLCDNSMKQLQSKIGKRITGELNESNKKQVEVAHSVLFNALNKPGSVDNMYKETCGDPVQDPFGTFSDFMGGKENKAQHIN